MRSSFVACVVQVNSYPTLMLFDGKGTHKLTTDRSIPGLEKWFAEVLPQVFPGEEPASPPEPAASTSGADSSTAGSFGGASGSSDVHSDVATPSSPTQEPEATPAPSPPSAKGKGRKSPVKDISFKSLVAATGNRVALFYFTSDGLHGKVGMPRRCSR
jgi:hypothetical protein